MLDKFMQHPLINALAVIVLTALIINWSVSVILALMGAPISNTGKSWFTKLMLATSLLGLPEVWDLLQTNGLVFVFAAIASFVFILNIVILSVRLNDKSTRGLVKDWPKWSIPILVMGGVAVAGYFTYFELTGGEISCGPTKGCDIVQNSQYATLFGIIPMGMFGLAGYTAILAAWLLWQYGFPSLRKLGSISMWGFCIFGVLFSVYLTFLEPFVIGSTCIWCVASAVYMMILLLACTPFAQQAFAMKEEKGFP